MTYNFVKNKKRFWHFFLNDNDRDYGCWVTAKHLEAGLALRTILGKTILVDNIRREEGDFTVFNLDVNNNHNYYVSSLGILVHNCNQVKKAVVREVKDAVKEKVKATRPPTAVGGSKGAPEPLRITPALPRGTTPGNPVAKSGTPIVNGPSESKQWKELQPYKEKTRVSGEGGNRKYYQWDRTHNDLEVYDRKGSHLGSMEPTTGEMYKPPVPGRKINL